MKPRVIPCLTISQEKLVKTTQFHNPRYLGDPINAVKIFNGKRVDELCVLDIDASKSGTEPNFSFLEKISCQAFMPLSYGGGVKTLDHAKKLVKMGYEKIIINTEFINNPKIVSEVSSQIGSQSVVVSIDVRMTKNGYKVFSKSGSFETAYSPVDLAQKAEQMGAGEILLTSIDHEGMMTGYDIELIKMVSSATTIPVIANGGASCIQDLSQAISVGKAHAVSASSLFVFWGKQKAVLITFPSENKLAQFGL